MLPGNLPVNMQRAFEVSVFLMLICFICLLFLATDISADTYSFIGPNGTVVFTDDPAKVPHKQKNMRTIVDSDPPVQPLKKSASTQVPKAARRHEQKDTAEVSRHDEFYPIGGYTFKDVQREIARRGARRGGGKVAVAWCQWQVSWRIHTRESGNHCAIDWVDTNVAYSITMPRWSNLASADKGMKEAWNKYYAGVLAHEETHAGHGISAGNEIQRSLSDLGGATTCRSIYEEGEQLARSIIKKYRAKDTEFDRVSGDDYDTQNEAMMAGDKADGVLGRQYPTRQKQ
jgi:predicted secreted Zn-dependent protease